MRLTDQIPSLMAEPLKEATKEKQEVEEMGEMETQKRDLA
jgi:hypothetical protein